MWQLPKKETRKSCVTKGETWWKAAGHWVVTKLPCRRCGGYDGGQWRALTTCQGCHCPTLSPGDAAKWALAGVSGAGRRKGGRCRGRGRGPHSHLDSGAKMVVARGSAPAPTFPSCRPCSAYTWHTCRKSKSQTRKAGSIQSLEVRAWPTQELLVLLPSGQR